MKFTHILGCVLLAASVFANDVIENTPEVPQWPYGIKNPTSMAAPRKGKGDDVAPAVLAWVPSGAKRIRAVLITVNNTDSKNLLEDPEVRAVCAKHETGIVYIRHGSPEGTLAGNPDSDVMDRVLAEVAQVTGIPEFTHAPMITVGKSSRGRFPFIVAWAKPERTIASIAWHAEQPTWPPASWARTKDETVLHCSVNGETEWGGTWHRHVRPALLNYRRHTAWLPHQIVSYSVAHGSYIDTHGTPFWEKPCPPQYVTCQQAWDYLAVFIDKALSLRLPEGKYPTQGPVKLRNVDPDSGYLIDIYAIESLFGLTPWNLEKKGDTYIVDPSSEEAPKPFIGVPPAKDYKVPAGVPISPLATEPSDFPTLQTKPLMDIMKVDPLIDCSMWASLRPKPGDVVELDGEKVAFQRGGARQDTLRIPSNKLRMLAYRVLEVTEPTAVRLDAPFTTSGRVQVLLNGIPVAHKQVIGLEKGLYPMLTVASIGTRWRGLRVSFKPVTEEQIAQAKKLKETAVKKQKERPQVVKIPIDQLIRKASDVPEAERRNMMWVADAEQAYAWFMYHRR